MREDNTDQQIEIKIFAASEKTQITVFNSKQEIIVLLSILTRIFFTKFNECRITFT